MNFLLIQLRRIGDVMMTTPAIRALRRAFPQARLSFLTASPADQILKYNPHLDQLLVYPGHPSFLQSVGFFQKIRKAKFDCVIDFQGNPRTAFLSLYSASPNRMGFNFRGRRWVYHHPIDRPREKSYSALHKLRLLQPLGVESMDLELEMPTGAEEQDFAERLFETLGVREDRLRVSVSPVSRQPFKVWPAANFAQLTDWLIETKKAQVFFLHGPNEEHFIKAVKENMKNETMPSIGVPNLLQTRAFLEKMHLHFGNDNGLRHLAIAAGIPTLAVFGKPSAVSWTPPFQTQHRFVEYDPGCKRSCTYPRCEHLSCIRDIPVQKVHQVLQEVLSQNCGFDAKPV